VRRRAAPALLLAGAFAALAAGCGARSNAAYTAKGTAACLGKKGFTGISTAAAKVGFIAAFAENGGLVAKTKDGNVLTIAFAADEADAASTQRAFRRHAPASLRRHMADIMEAQRNAVLVWTVSPTAQQLADAESCLAA
jgi:hypothetical protein